MVGGCRAGPRRTMRPAVTRSRSGSTTSTPLSMSTPASPMQKFIPMKRAPPPRLSCSGLRHTSPLTASERSIASSPTMLSLTGIQLRSRPRSMSWAHDRSSSNRTGHGRTARSSVSTAPLQRNGHTANPSPPIKCEPMHLHPGSTATTLNASTRATASRPQPECHQPDGPVQLGRVWLTSL